MDNKKNITISTFNLYIGGSLTIYSNIKEYIFKYKINNFTFLDDNCIYKNVANFKYIKYPFNYLNPLYRLYLEQIYLPIFALYNGSRELIMMGNFPCLLWPFKQKVFFHNLLYLESSSSSFKTIIEKNIFLFIMKFKKPKVLVQTLYVKKQLSNKFKNNLDIDVIGFPMINTFKKRFVNNNLYNNNNNNNKYNEDLILFYPAFAYEHKNHNLLFKMSNWLVKNKIKIYLTITDHDVCSLNVDDFIRSPFKFIGNVSYNDISDIYCEADGLIFPSRTESLGIPLLEAISYSLPIIAPSVDYVKSVVSNFYSFELDNIRSLEKCLHIFKEDCLKSKKVLPTSNICLEPEMFFSELIK